MTGGSVVGQGGTVSLGGLLQNLSLSGNTSLSTGTPVVSGVTNQGLLSVGVSIALSLSGTFQNSGTVALSPPFYADAQRRRRNDQGNTGVITTTAPSVLNPSSDLSLTGGGSVILLQAPKFSASFLAMRLTSSNVITGSGTLGNSSFKFTNSGFVTVTSGVLTITTNAATDAFFISGVLLSNGGTLLASGGTISNANGTINASGGVISFPGVVVGRDYKGRHRRTGTNRALREQG